MAEPEQDDSSEPSTSTVESVEPIPEPKPIIATPTPEPTSSESSVSSKSDSYECQSDYMGEMKNF